MSAWRHALACHGEKGQSTNPEVPSLGAQTSPYVLIQLYLFREKAASPRRHERCRKSLHRDDLRTFGRHDLQAAAAAADGRHDRSGAHGRGASPGSPNIAATSCHSPDLGGRDAVPRIAGQREDFLVKTMRSTKPTYVLDTDASMGDVLQPVPDAEISSISAYFAAQQLRGGYMRCNFRMLSMVG